MRCLMKVQYIDHSPKRIYNGGKSAVSFDLLTVQAASLQDAHNAAERRYEHVDHIDLVKVEFVKWLGFYGCKDPRHLNNARYETLRQLEEMLVCEIKDTLNVVQ